MFYITHFELLLFYFIAFVQYFILLSPPLTHSLSLSLSLLQYYLSLSYPSELSDEMYTLREDDFPPTLTSSKLSVTPPRSGRAYLHSTDDFYYFYFPDCVLFLIRCPVPQFY